MRTVRLAAIVAVAAAFSTTVVFAASPATPPDPSSAASSAAPILSSTSDTKTGKRVTSVPPAEYRPSAVAAKAAAAFVAPRTNAHRIDLGAPTPSERSLLKAKNAARSVGRVRPRAKSALAIGFPRALPAKQRTLLLSDLPWQALADGSRVARIEVHSPGAAALRVSLALPAAHPDLALRLAGNGARAKVMGPYPANAVAAASERDGKFWSPVLEGDTAVIELTAGAGATIGGLALTFGPASHLVVAGESLRDIDSKRHDDIGAADPCNIDMACVAPSPALTEAANSVGKLVFNDTAGSTYVCTGTMLNDSTTSFTPYLFSASHCFDEARDDGAAFRASTTNVYWFFRALDCGSTDIPPYALQTSGAMLLARSEDYDWALLRMYSEPPAGVFFAAWRAEPVPQFAIATGLHHPAGDLAKFSQGTSPGYQEYSDGSSFIAMQWSQGTTEQGSSGSALFTFLASGDYYEVRGGLFGGDASCDNRAGNDYYSRLDHMLPQARQYLTPDAANPDGQAVAIEFYNIGLDHYFISTDANEINLLDTGVLRGWVRTGIRFLAYNTPQPGTNPVCRFYLRPEVGDSHFYSADPAECERVRIQFGESWTYESPSVFHIQLPNMVTGACPAGTRPIWRFFNTRTTNHRYTPEVTIRDELQADPTWIAEGYGPDTVIMCSPDSN